MGEGDESVNIRNLILEGRSGKRKFEMCELEDFIYDKGCPEIKENEEFGGYDVADEVHDCGYAVAYEVHDVADGVADEVHDVADKVHEVADEVQEVGACGGLDDTVCDDLDIRGMW